VAVGVKNSNLCSLPGVAQRDRPADARPATGDHRNVLVEQPRHFFFPFALRVPGDLTIQRVPLHRNLLTGVRPRVTLSRIGAQQSLPRRRLRGLQEARAAPTIVPSQCRRFRGRRAGGLAPCVSVTANMEGIQMSKALLKLGVLSLSALTFPLVLTAANAQERVRWKMQSAFGSQLPHLGPSGVRFSKDIERMSGGKFEVKFYEPGALTPPLECFDAVSKGSIESCWTTPGYHTGKYPALAFFTTVAFGPGFGEFLAWKWFGGGNKLRDEVYAKHGLVA